MTSDGRFSYTWDVNNRLIAMETHATIPQAARRKLSFAYDSMGRRIRKTVWHGSANGGWQLYHQIDFLHELGGWNLLAERSGGSTGSFLRSYTWGTDLSGTYNGAGGVGGLLFCTLHTSGKTFAYGSDLNGNVTLLIDTATDQSAATYDYGPFGEALRQSGEYAALNPYRFSTKYTDNETGLLDYGYRLYNPSTGRWLSRDPIEERGGVNLYGFVGNDGVNGWDYLGLNPPHMTYPTTGKIWPHRQSSVNITGPNRQRLEESLARIRGRTSMPESDGGWLSDFKASLYDDEITLDDGANGIDSWDDSVLDDTLAHELSHSVTRIENHGVNDDEWIGWVRWQTPKGEKCHRIIYGDVLSSDAFGYGRLFSGDSVQTEYKLKRAELISPVEDKLKDWKH